MSRTYQATGIILKGMPLGEADRLVTILTPEFGLIRAVAPGARKHRSPLRGRSELFVVNHLMLAKGRSLDKITQAETIKSYPGLSREVGKLVAAQYLAEIALCLALSEQTQTALYELLNEHLHRLDVLSYGDLLYAYLAQAVFHLLAIAGIAPQVHRCCLTQEFLSANFADPQWRVGFSFDAGGLIDLSGQASLAEAVKITPGEFNQPSPFRVNNKLGALELTLLQHLGSQSLPQPTEILPQEFLSPSLEQAWVRVEHLLRDYAQYHFGYSFRSAALVDTLVPLEF